MYIFASSNDDNMISDKDTNKVYIAKGLLTNRYGKIANNLTNAFKANGIEYDFLPQTESDKHIWARDYMPIQIGTDSFLLYSYNPDYLQDEPKYIPNYKSICDDLNINYLTTDIVIDGGNVVKNYNKAIMTDKIFKENQKYAKSNLLNKLEKLLNAEIAIIPWDTYEEFGHADGMIRFVDENTVLLNNYIDFNKSLRKRLIDLLSKKINVIELHYDTTSNMNWAYINYLQVGKNLFVPQLGLAEDNLALLQLQSIFPDCQIIPIDDCKALVDEGGALNCCTWNIMK